MERSPQDILQEAIMASYGLANKAQKLEIDEQFLPKQERVLKTEKGQKLAHELMNFRMSYIDQLILGTPQGQEAFAKYKASIEDEYNAINKPSEIIEKEKEIEALKAELERVRSGM